MECIICGHPSKYYFSKKFNNFNLNQVEYYKCINCDFVHSETHRLMSAESWLELNHDYHNSYQGGDANVDDPRWLERIQAQAYVINDLAGLQLLNKEGDWLDYACGDGKLFDSLKINGNLFKYDEYMHKENYQTKNQLMNKHFDFVITTSVFEHLLERRHFEAINSLVSDKGVMGLHTMVCEQVPCDPTWFYLIPVHCAFHTNKSISILLKQWGYVESIYNVNSRLWFFFKQNDLSLEKIINRANERMSAPMYLYKSGFVDYWK